MPSTNGADLWLFKVATLVEAKLIEDITEIRSLSVQGVVGTVSYVKNICTSSVPQLNRRISRWAFSKWRIEIELSQRLRKDARGSRAWRSAGKEALRYNRSHTKRYLAFTSSRPHKRPRWMTNELKLEKRILLPYCESWLSKSLN